MIDFKKELFSNALKQRIPLIATIEIISQCNFRCVHCYIENKCRKDILTFEEIEDFGNQIIRMGCLYVVLTGGEVLLHPDFERIYLFFIQKGVCVSVFTNGSLINDKIINLFTQYPPRVVEITMYGFNQDTYKLVTKKNLFENVKKNVLSLKNNGINVLLKMFVINENYKDFQSVYQFAIENKISFKFDSLIIANKDSREMNYQISENHVLELSQKVIGEDRKYNDETYNYVMNYRYNKLYQCGAGRNSCWLKSNYHLRMCNFLSCVEFDLRSCTGFEAWQQMKLYIEEDIAESSDCYKCVYRTYCDYCPAKSYVTYNTTDMNFHQSVYCKVAQMRYREEKIGKHEE